MLDTTVLLGLKAVLTTVLLVLAVYQVLLMLVGYGRVRIRPLSARAAASSHRAIGDTVLVAALVVATLCVGLFGPFATYETRVLVHSIAGWAFLALLVVKVVAVRRGGARLGRLLPVIGSALLALLVVVWATSALVLLEG